MAIWQPVGFNPMKSKRFIWSTFLITASVCVVDIPCETKQRLATFGDGWAMSHCSSTGNFAWVIPWVLIMPQWDFFLGKNTQNWTLSGRCVLRVNYICCSGFPGCKKTKTYLQCHNRWHWRSRVQNSLTDSGIGPYIRLDPSTVTALKQISRICFSWQSIQLHNPLLFKHIQPFNWGWLWWLHVYCWQKLWIFTRC